MSRAKAFLVGALGDDAEGDLVAGPLIEGDRITGRFIRAARPSYNHRVQKVMNLDVITVMHPSLCKQI